MRLTWLLIAGLAVVPLHAQQDVLVPTNIQRYYTPVRLFLQGAAAVMPEDKYTFKLAPEQMDFGQWINHSTERNYLDCSTLRGETNPMLFTRHPSSSGYHPSFTPTISLPLASAPAGMPHR